MNDMTAPEIYGQAITQHSRPKRAEALRILRRYIDYPDEGPANRQDLVTLYSVLSGPIPRRPRTAWEWVAQAIPKKPPRPVLACIQVAPGERVTATDTVVLHSIAMGDMDGREPMQPGLYTPQGDLTDLSLFDYPDWDHFVPSTPSYAVKLRECPLGRFTGGDDVTVFRQLPLPDGQAGPWVDLEYLRRALTTETRRSLDDEVQISCDSEAGPVCLHLPDRIALIMPLCKPNDITGAMANGTVMLDRPLSADES